MTIVQRILREKAALAGVGTALIGLLLVLGLNPTVLGAVAIFAGAVTTLLRQVLTPTAEVIVQQKPGEEAKVVADDLVGVRKGDTAWVKKRTDERGAIDLLIAMLVAVTSFAGGVSIVFGFGFGLVVLAVVALVALRVWFWQRRSKRLSARPPGQAAILIL